jgi:hypothetical protein
LAPLVLALLVLDACSVELLLQPMQLAFAGGQTFRHADQRALLFGELAFALQEVVLTLAAPRFVGVRLRGARARIEHVTGGLGLFRRRGDVALQRVQSDDSRIVAHVQRHGVTRVFGDLGHQPRPLFELGVRQHGRQHQRELASPGVVIDER